MEEKVETVCIVHGIVRPFESDSDLFKDHGLDLGTSRESTRKTFKTSF